MEAKKEEQGGVIHFLVAEGVRTRDIHQRIAAVYGEHCMSLTNVHEWQKRFLEGRTSLQDDSHPGQVHRVVTTHVTARIDDLLRKNRRMAE